MSQNDEHTSIADMSVGTVVYVPTRATIWLTLAIYLTRVRSSVRDADGGTLDTER